MADRTVGDHLRIALVYRVEGPRQQEKITALAHSDVDQSHIFLRPRVPLIEIFSRLDRPFFDVTDDISRRHCRLQSQCSQTFAYGKHLTKGQRDRRFPTAFTHGGSSLPPAHQRTGRSAFCTIVVSSRYRSMPSFRVAASNCCTSSSLNQTTVSRCAASMALVVEL